MQQNAAGGEGVLDGLDESSPYVTSPVPPVGACRGAEPFCVIYLPPRVGDQGG